MSLKQATLLLFMIFNFQTIFCCTNFSVTIDGVTWAAGNEDYPDNSQIWIRPPENGKFGSVIFGLSHYPPADGMNDQGLYFGTNTAPFKKIPENEGAKKGDLFEFTYEVLEKCAKIDCVVDIFKNYNFADTGFEQGQLIFADQFGGGVVLEGHTEFYKDGTYLITANYYNSEPDLEFSDPAMQGGEGHGRVKTVKYWLSQMEKLNISDVKTAMRAVSGSVTQYSNIYDLKNSIIYVYHQRDYDNVAVVDLSKNFQNGEQLFQVEDLDFISSSDIESTFESSDETEHADETVVDIDNYTPETKEKQNQSGCSIGGFYEI